LPDRSENIRRIGEVAHLMVDAGVTTIVAFISPIRADRDRARALFRDGEFVEVFVDTPISVCKERDPKGLYAKAMRGQIPNFTGVDSIYEAPLSPEMRLVNDGRAVADCVAEIVAFLADQGFIARAVA
jgi:adenylyl-sulfate kinase